jgi:tetratricopeptide (TPR) repeat protein
MPQRPAPAAHTANTVQAAVEGLRRAAAARPADPRAFLELGDLLGRLGRCEEAVAVFEEGLALAPDAIVLRVGLGYVHLNRNDRAAARDQFARVRAAAPGRYDGLVGMANVLALDGEYAVAADLYRRALELQPNNEVTQISLARCLLEMGQREAGEAALRAVARSGGARVWPAITALSATPHGRVFLSPSAAAGFLGAPPDCQARN